MPDVVSGEPRPLSDVSESYTVAEIRAAFAEHASPDDWGVPAFYEGGLIAALRGAYRAKHSGDGGPSFGGSLAEPTAEVREEWGVRDEVSTEALRSEGLARQVVERAPDRWSLVKRTPASPWSEVPDA